MRDTHFSLSILLSKGFFIKMSSRGFNNMPGGQGGLNATSGPDHPERGPDSSRPKKVIEVPTLLNIHTLSPKRSGSTGSFAQAPVNVFFPEAHHAPRLKGDLEWALQKPKGNAVAVILALDKPLSDEFYALLDPGSRGKVVIQLIQVEHDDLNIAFTICRAIQHLFGVDIDVLDKHYNNIKYAEVDYSRDGMVCKDAIYFKYDFIADAPPNPSIGRWVSWARLSDSSSQSTTNWMKELMYEIKSKSN